MMQVRQKSAGGAGVEEKCRCYMRQRSCVSRGFGSRVNLLKYIRLLDLR